VKLENGKKEYRSRLDITAAILRASMGGSTKTRLMYSAFLSYKQCDHYLSWMTDKKLLELTDSIYMISENGRQFLSTYEKLTKQLDRLIPRDSDVNTQGKSRAAHRLTVRKQ
jgi:predicted transcriptional regulator